MDNFYLNNACYLIEHALGDAALQPPARATFGYGAAGGRGHEHAWSGDNDGGAGRGRSCHSAPPFAFMHRDAPC